MRRPTLILALLAPLMIGGCPEDLCRTWEKLSAQAQDIVNWTQARFDQVDVAAEVACTAVPFIEEACLSGLRDLRSLGEKLGLAHEKLAAAEQLARGYCPDAPVEQDPVLEASQSRARASIDQRALARWIKNNDPEELR